MPTTLVDTVTGQTNPDGTYTLVTATLHFGDATTESIADKTYTIDERNDALAFVTLFVQPARWAAAIAGTPNPQPGDADIGNFLALVERATRVHAHPAVRPAPPPTTAPPITI